MANGDIEGTMPVPAIGKAMLILDYLAQSPEPRSLKEIHECLDLPKTSAYSLLKSLAACGVVRRTPAGLYQPGIKLYTLGVSARVMLEQGRILLPRLRALRDELGHTVFMSLYDNGEQVVWEKVDGFESVLFRAYRGERKKLNTSSAGKVIAAFLPPLELQMALSKGMARATANTIVSQEAFLKHLETVRANGYAIDDEEGEPGIFCVGAPVFTRDRQVYGAVSMSALKSAIRISDMETYTAALKRAAADISDSL